MNFTKVRDYMDSLIASGLPCCDMAVYRDHECIYRYMTGWKDENKKTKLEGNETYNLYSCSKVFTTCAAMQLIEHGKISLDDPVYRYLPAYGNMKVRDGNGARPAERTMLIRHLMSMQSGLNYDRTAPEIEEILKQTAGMASTRQIVDAKAADLLEFEPGTNWLYGLSHDVLAAVIEVASGMRFSEYLDLNIFKPLALDTIGFVVKKENENRQCAQYEYNSLTGNFDPVPRFELNYRYSSNYESGGAGLVSDVRDCIVFADAMACGGESKQGEKILSPQMIQLWNTNQLGPESRRSFDAWNRKGYSYALGVRTRVDKHMGGRGSVGEFGWDGAACSYMLIDPHMHLSVFFATHVKGYGYAYDVIHPTLRNLVYEVLEE